MIFNQCGSVLSLAAVDIIIIIITVCPWQKAWAKQLQWLFISSNDETCLQCIFILETGIPANLQSDTVKCRKFCVAAHFRNAWPAVMKHMDSYRNISGLEFARAVNHKCVQSNLQLSATIYIYILHIYIYIGLQCRSIDRSPAWFTVQQCQAA